MGEQQKYRVVSNLFLYVDEIEIFFVILTFGQDIKRGNLGFLFELWQE